MWRRRSTTGHSRNSRPSSSRFRVVGPPARLDPFRAAMGSDAFIGAVYSEVVAEGEQSSGRGGRLSMRKGR